MPGVTTVPSLAIQTYTIISFISFLWKIRRIFFEEDKLHVFRNDSILLQTDKKITHLVLKPCIFNHYQLNFIQKCHV